MADPILQSRTEAVQPSLWDRLVDDLPGIVSETDRQRADLVSRVGAAKVEEVLAAGVRSIEVDDDFDPDTKRDLHQFLTQMARRAFLEQRGIVVNASVLREAVRRDIEALFNVERYESGVQLSDLEQKGFETPQEVIAAFPHVRRSVINYGVPSFSGRSASDFDMTALAKELREVIAVFEPRLKRDTIRVKVSQGDRTGMLIQVEAMLMLSPVPERLRLSTKIDLDNGRATTAVEDA
ncbi:type VI secretion system baseplate subunit TssE [Tabrizicola sp.]|uniref:type VI secretion system baseplate subunit TssE n=1 Tax=Tabrizicola sp. TaxID=2005166 RepID=UPI001A59ADA7|nr:type VI secretion system baseplate subunit TssE [Tabrizicola sp.]MBL9063807.1 type VI secretion system baseplate subunit TssE [Tabrizicola sp.]